MVFMVGVGVGLLIAAFAFFLATEDSSPAIPVIFWAGVAILVTIIVIVATVALFPAAVEGLVTPTPTVVLGR